MIKFFPGTDLLSSDEDKNIVAMPIEVTRDRDTHRNLNHLMYGQEPKKQAYRQQINNRVCHAGETLKISDLTKDTYKDGGSKLREMIPDGSYIISKENYIISKQVFSHH